MANDRNAGRKPSAGFRMGLYVSGLTPEQFEMLSQRGIDRTRSAWLLQAIAEKMEREEADKSSLTAVMGKLQVELPV
jgi:hypothetical protein